MSTNGSKPQLTVSKTLLIKKANFIARQNKINASMEILQQRENSLALQPLLDFMLQREELFYLSLEEDTKLASRLSNHPEQQAQIKALYQKLNQLLSNELIHEAHRFGYRTEREVYLTALAGMAETRGASMSIYLKTNPTLAKELLNHLPLLKEINENCLVSQMRKMKIDR